ncbi:MAG: oligosaccharide flippase family protein, partial [Flavobacteriales bacterium]|nr:oligosaccharide flippase family protein [Flavobacteriales bacterium]
MVAFPRLKDDFKKSVLGKSDFTRHVLTLSTGTALSQIIPILLAPLLTRLYTPVDFGLLTIYVSLSSLIAIVSTGRYEMAIVLPREDKDAVGIFALSLSIASGISLVSLLVFWTFQSEISGWYNEPQIKPWLLLIPLTVFLTGISQTLNYWLTRQKKFKSISAAKVSDSSLNNLVKVGLGFRTTGVGGLIIGNIIGQFMFVL